MEQDNEKEGELGTPKSSVPEQSPPEDTLTSNTASHGGDSGASHGGDALDDVPSGTMVDRSLAKSLQEEVVGHEKKEQVLKNWKWYMVHVQSGKEYVAKASLETRIKEEEFDNVQSVIVPVYSEAIYKNGKKKRVEKKSFPGYICVEMEYSASARAFVQEIPYISGFVSRGKAEPTPLTEREIQAIITKKEDPSQDTQTVHVDFDVGQKVLIVDGPFNNFSGTVESISAEKGKLSVNIEIFGRQTPVEIDYYKVKKQ